MSPTLRLNGDRCWRGDPDPFRWVAAGPAAPLTILLGRRGVCQDRYNTTHTHRRPTNHWRYLGIRRRMSSSLDEELSSPQPHEDSPRLPPFSLTSPSLLTSPAAACAELPARATAHACRPCAGGTVPPCAMAASMSERDARVAEASWRARASAEGIEGALRRIHGDAATAASAESDASSARDAS